MRVIGGRCGRRGNVSMRSYRALPMIAAVTARAFDAATELAPAGVEVLRLPDGREAAAFILPDWEDRETIEALPQFEQVRVVQALSAGTEWVVGALLGDAYGQFVAARTRRWSDATPQELQGAHVLIVGFGSIGQAVKRRLEPFGVVVTGVARRARDGVRETAELPTLVAQADAVVVLTPLTPE